MKNKCMDNSSGKWRRKLIRKKTWQWLSRGDSKVRTEALLCATQEQAIRTNYIKYHIDKASEGLQCRLCGKKGESMQHITSRYETSAQKECKRRHNNVAKKVQWDICKKEQFITQWNVVWACSGRSIREWGDQNTVEHKYLVWQSDGGKTTWPNSYWQKRIKGDNYWYWCASWYEGRGKKRKSGKVPGFEKRDETIVEIEKCRNCHCSHEGLWKCFCRIW